MDLTQEPQPPPLQPRVGNREGMLVKHLLSHHLLISEAQAACIGHCICRGIDQAGAAQLAGGVLVAPLSWLVEHWLFTAA